MNVSLTPELEKFVQAQVDSQRYQTASEVMREALRLLQHEKAVEQARLESLRHDVRAGFAEVEQGRFIEGRELTVDRIRKLAIERFGPPKSKKRGKQ